MIIRKETPSDCRGIEKIHFEAFANHPFSKQTEHFIVNGLRKAGVLTISLVAEVDGNLVGHIAFSPAKIADADGGWFILGPVGVLPPLQKTGIGSALIEEGLKQLRENGAAGCVLVGDPAFYKRFGFQNYPGLLMEGIPPEVIMGLSFGGTIPAGEIGHHSAFWATE